MYALLAYPTCSVNLVSASSPGNIVQIKMGRSFADRPTHQRQRSLVLVFIRKGMFTCRFGPFVCVFTFWLRCEVMGIAIEVCQEKMLLFIIHNHHHHLFYYYSGHPVAIVGLYINYSGFRCPARLHQNINFFTAWIFLKYR